MFRLADLLDGCGRVWLSAHLHRRHRRIQARDEGPGLPAEIRQRLFEPFTTTKSRGTGLGLAITRRIIEARHGRITLACPRDGGTLAIVTLPVDITTLRPRAQ